MKCLLNCRIQVS